MRYLLFILLLGNMQLSATDVCWDGTDSGKNAYTRSLHLRYQGDIEKLADSTFKKPVHPFYQMLFWAQRSSVIDKLENWLVQHLLNTAGHWGWSKDKTAGNCETNIYYEVGLCQLLSQPQTPVTAQAPQLLAQIRKDSKQMLQDADIKVDWRSIDWKAYSQFRSFWRTEGGWEVPMNNRKSLTRYYITSLFVSVAIKDPGDEAYEIIEPYVRAGAYQKLNEVSRKVFNCLSKYIFPGLIFDDIALESFLREISKDKSPDLVLQVQQQEALKVSENPNSSNLDTWAFELEDGTPICRNHQWIYLGNMNRNYKSIAIESLFINDMPLSSPLELEHTSTPEEMFAAIRRSGLNVKRVRPPSLDYLLRR